MLAKYCFECHGEKETKGDLDLVAFATAASVSADAHVLAEIEARVRSAEMPPRSQPQPSELERKELLSWIDGTIRTASSSLDPGSIPPRRLTRAEWRNAVRDVLGVTDDLTTDFPADGSGGAGFDNTADTLFVSPLLLERYLAAAQAAAQRCDRSALLAALAPEFVLDRSGAAFVIASFGRRLFRRPLEGSELSGLLAEFDSARAAADRELAGDSFERGLRAALRTALVSPAFLYRIERDRPGVTDWEIDDYELAARLAAFLWSSNPDERLLDLARDGRLRSDEVLASETERLLDDPRSDALADDFALQWLHVRELLTAAEPDRNRFPAYTNALRSAMIGEARLLFRTVLREGRTLDELVSPGFTFLNEPLAKHYGIDGVVGDEMRRVVLTTPRRGGILRLGAVLTVTAYPLRTSPVNRGKFILDEVLGTPPPPPPANVGFLPADEHQDDKLTARQRLERHRADPKCAACHERMDPLGFALERYDAIGAWRDEFGGAPIDDRAVLSDGTDLDGISGLERYVLGEKRSEFVRAFSEKLLGYALARELRPNDRVFVDAIVARSAPDAFTVRSLIHAIVESVPFRRRGNSSEKSER